MGREVHFHSFGKTWQIMGAKAGVNRRAAQEVLAQLGCDVPVTAGALRPPGRQARGPLRPAYRFNSLLSWPVGSIARV